MKCEHGKEILIVLQLNGEYWDDGGHIHIEGCELCKPTSVVRKHEDSVENYEELEE